MTSLPEVWTQCISKDPQEDHIMDHVIQRKQEHNLHFYDWHILRGRVHGKLSLHEFDSEKDGLVSWLQHLSQELYQKQHYNQEIQQGTH